MVRISLLGRRLLDVFVCAMLSLFAWVILSEQDQDAAIRVIGYLCLVGAAVVLARCHYLLADTRARVLSRRVGVVFGFPLVRIPFDDIQRIALVEEIRLSSSRKSDDGSRTVYVLRLNSSKGRKLYELDDMAHARRIAERLCRALSVDLQNRLRHGSSTRAAADLDTPLAERWRQEGVHHEAPQLASTSTARIDHEGDRSEFSAPVEPLSRSLVLAVMAVVYGGLYAIGRYTDAPGIIPLLIGAVVTFFGTLFIAQHSGRNRVRFTADTVEFRRGAIVRQRIALARIEELLANAEELVLMGDDGYLALERPRDPADAEAQRQFVERQIAQRQPALIRTSSRPSS